MSIAELLSTLTQRLLDYQQSGNADAVLNDTALGDAVRLRDAVGFGADEQTFAQQLAEFEALRVLGWLHYFRYHALPAGPDQVELAHALLYFGLLSSNSDVIPASLRDVVGPAAEPAAQADLGAALLRYLEEANTADRIPLDVAIDLLSSASAADFADISDRSALLYNRGLAHSIRFDDRGADADLERAIEFIEHAVTITADDHPNRPVRLSNLGLALQKRFDRMGAMVDLQRASDVINQAVVMTPDGHPNRPLYQFNLSTIHHHLFGHLGKLTDLEQAIRLGEASLAAIPLDHPSRICLMSSLGVYHRLRFEHLGEPADLDRAVQLSEAAVESPSSGDRDRAKDLANLCTALVARFLQNGIPSDLDHAIEIGEQAVLRAPNDDTSRAGMLANLGHAYQLRYRSSGILRDLDRAIEAGEQAVAFTAPASASLPLILSTLGTAWQCRYDRTGTVSDLDRAVEVGEAALSGVDADHPGRPGFLSNVGVALRVHAVLTGQWTELDRAIEFTAQAVALTPADHPDKADYLSNLGIAHQDRYAHTRDPADLDSAIGTGQHALTLTAADHPRHAAMLANVGIALLASVEARLGHAEQQLVTKLAGLMSQTSTSAPSDQVDAGFAVGALANAVGQPSTAATVLDATVALLPSVAPRASGWADQEHRLSRHAGLVAEAVAAHCAVQDWTGAIEIAEQGRTILLAHQLDSRTDLTDLEAAHSTLAARFWDIRHKLDRVPDSTVRPGTSQNWIQTRQRWWVEHDDLLRQIRQQPGFASFLRPPKLATLTPAARGGVVVLINTGRDRSDAIILADGADPRPVVLPELTRSDVHERAAAVLDATDGTSLIERLQAPRIVSETLAWLWATVVGPVLDALPAATPAGSRRRVWWMPTGWLSLLPLHAAQPPDGPGALDTVISSYTPTLRALANARSRPPASIRERLIVALEHTPGEADLPHIKTEARTLSERYPDFRLLLDQEATSAEVLAALPHTMWTHFACHARIDSTAPADSGLQLHDRSLTLSEVSQLRLDQAELAYLSACSTAASGWRNPDEALHLASAFQLAGFRHVIASLWPLRDDVAATAADSFYTDLDGPATDTAADALHHTTCALRSRYPDQPQLWASLVHAGP